MAFLEEVLPVMGMIGGAISIVSTAFVWLKGGFKFGFDSQKALEDIAALKLKDKELEVQLEEEVKLLNLQIMQKVTESRTQNADATNALRVEVVNMNAHILALTEKIGRLTGLVEGQLNK